MKITIERNGRVSELECDEYVLLTWNMELDGSKVFPPLLSASAPPEALGTEMVYTVGVLANAMMQNPNETVQVVGSLMKATLEKGLGMLEAASQGEIPEG